MRSPPRKRSGSAGGRRPAFDEIRYKQRDLRRTVIKQWRWLATRYDKLAIAYRAAVVLSACITWTRHIGDTPYRRHALVERERPRRRTEYAFERLDVRGKHAPDVRPAHVGADIADIEILQKKILAFGEPPPG